MPFIAQGKTNLRYILIVVILSVIVGGGILGYYLSWIKELEAKLTKIELKLTEVSEKSRYEEEPTNLFLAGSNRESVLVIIYNRDQKKITKEKIINLNGLSLDSSGCQGWGKNDSVQYNIATGQILLSIDNISAFDGSLSPDAPYAQAILVASFDSDAPQVIFIPEGNILSWITHSSKPMVYIAHQIPSTSNEEILEINLLNKKVRKIADVGNISNSNHLELIMSKDENFIFQAVRLHNPKNKVLIKKVNLENDDILTIDLEDSSNSFDTNNLSPDEKYFAFFGGFMAETGLRIRNLEQEKTDILPLPENQDIANSNILWSGDNKNLLFLIKTNDNRVPFIYSLEQKEGRIINSLINQHPLIWAPATNYIILKERLYNLEDQKYNNLNWSIFDLENNKIEDVYSSSSLWDTVGAHWF